MAQPDSQGTPTNLEYLKDVVFRDLDVRKEFLAIGACAKWRSAVWENCCQQFISMKVDTDEEWKSLAQRYQWDESIQCTNDFKYHHKFYLKIVRIIDLLGTKWREGKGCNRFIYCHRDPEKLGDGPQCLQLVQLKLVCGFSDHTIRIWDDMDSLATPRVLRGHKDKVTCLQFDKTTLISGSQDATVNMWDIDTGELMHSRRLTSLSSLSHFRSRQGILVACDKGDIEAFVWSIEKASVKCEDLLFKHHAQNVTAVHLDDKYIVSASEDKTIRLWDITTGNLERTMPCDEYTVQCMDYLDLTLAGGCSDGYMRLWKTDSGICYGVVRDSKTSDICYLQLNLQCRLIVCGDSKGRLHVWDLLADADPKAPYRALPCPPIRVHPILDICGLQFDHCYQVSCTRDGTIAIRSLM